MPVKKNVNKNFFKKWTPEMAYVLGFFFADGSYDVNPRRSEYFSFQITDGMLLHNIRNALSSSHKIATRHARMPNDSLQYRLQIGSKEMCADLQEFGIRQNKASTARFPKVPKKYTGDFIRGYFDGDGNVWSGYAHKQRAIQKLTLLTAFTSCLKKFLEDLQGELREYELGNGSLFKIKKSNAHRLQYSAKDSIILFNLMYRKSIQDGLFLKRKKIVFEKFVENKNAVCKQSLRTPHSKRMRP
jgi:intein-encoded DNA endonuclease-like protein